MESRLLRYTVAVLSVSVLLNLALVLFVLSREGARAAFGQEPGGASGFVVAAAQTNDQSALCFVMHAGKPQLLVYRSDAAGQLYLTSARDVECDLKLHDVHLPRGSTAGRTSTQPSVKTICDAVKNQGQGGKDKQDKQKDEKEEKGAKEKKDGDKDKEDEGSDKPAEKKK